MAQSVERLKEFRNLLFFDVAVFQDLICVTNVQNKTNVIVNKNTGSFFNTLWNSRGEPFLALALYSEEVQPLQTDICNNSGCSDLCIPDASGPLCMCREGFMLNQDGKTCSPDLGKFHRAFVWSNKTHICLMDIRILTTKNWVDVMECIYDQGSSISFLDIDMNERKIVFADGSDIFVVDIEQMSAKSRLAASKSPITGLAIDWRDNNVYWSEGMGSGSIKIVSQTTMDVYTLVDSDLVNPRNLLLLPLTNMMFWISGVRGSIRIERSRDGSNRTVILSSGPLTYPVSLTADSLTDRLYFVDNGLVKSSQIDGTDLKDFVQSPPFFGPLMVHLYQNYLVVADSDFPVGQLKTLSKHGANITYAQSTINVNSLTDMAVLDPSLQPDLKGPCEIYNGGCEQICISNGRNRTCQCEYGYQLDPNRETCSSASLLDDFFLVTDWTHNKIYQVSLVNNEIRAVDTETYGSPVGIEYNYVTHNLIWSSGFTAHQMNIKTGDYTILLNTENFDYRIERFAIDYTSGNVYFTAVSDNPVSPGLVAVLSTSGDHKKLINDSATPRAVALDSQDGLLFWTDHGTKPPIVKKANMDGTNPQTIISSGIVLPTGLAIDTAAKKLYLADGATNIIQRCTYQGVCTVFYTDTEAHLMDIKLLGDFLYYTAWNRVYVTKLKTTNVKDASRLAEKAELGRLDSLALYSSSLSKQTAVTTKITTTSATNTFTSTTTLTNTTSSSSTTSTSTATTAVSFTTRETNSKSSTSISTRSQTALSDHQHENNQLPLAAIGGGVGGSVVLVIFIVIAVLCLKRSRTMNQHPSTVPSLNTSSQIFRVNNDGGYLTPHITERPDNMSSQINNNDGYLTPYNRERPADTSQIFRESNDGYLSPHVRENPNSTYDYITFD